AEPLIVRATALLERQVGADNVLVAPLLEFRAMAEWGNDNHDAAEADLQKALRIREAAVGATPQAQVPNLKLQAGLYADRRRWDDAISAQLRTLGILEKRSAPEDLEMAQALAWLADFNLAKNRDKTAATPVDRALA